MDPGTAQRRRRVVARAADDGHVRPVFQGGPGAWEVVFRASRIDLDDRTTRGGRFWRITPTVNWHLSDHVRLALIYGYGRLHRFDVTGNTHFFQSRLQFLL